MSRFISRTMIACEKAAILTDMALEYFLFQIRNMLFERDGETEWFVELQANETKRQIFVFA
jgi:hypothetical protein